MWCSSYHYIASHMINISALTYLHNKSPRNLVAFNNTLIASSSSEVDWAQLGGFLLQLQSVVD